MFMIAMVWMIMLTILRPPARLPEWFGERQLWKARLYSPWDPASSTGGCHHFYDDDHNDNCDDYNHEK